MQHRPVSQAKNKVASHSHPVNIRLFFHPNDPNLTWKQLTQGDQKPSFVAKSKNQRKNSNSVVSWWKQGIWYSLLRCFAFLTLALLVPLLQPIHVSSQQAWISLKDTKHDLSGKMCKLVEQLPHFHNGFSAAKNQSLPDKAGNTTGLLYLKENGMWGNTLTSQQLLQHSPTVSCTFLFKHKWINAGNFLFNFTIGRTYLKPKMAKSSL